MNDTSPTIDAEEDLTAAGMYAYLKQTIIEMASDGNELLSMVDTQDLSPDTKSKIVKTSIEYSSALTIIAGELSAIVIPDSITTDDTMGDPTIEYATVMALMAISDKIAEASNIYAQITALLLGIDANKIQELDSEYISYAANSGAARVVIGGTND